MREATSMTTIDDLLPNRIIQLEQQDFLEEILGGMPTNIARKLRANWSKTAPHIGLAAANTALREYVDSTKFLVHPESNDESLRNWAQRRADSVARLSADAPDDDAAYALALTVSASYDIPPPDDAPPHTTQSNLRRMLDAQWWRRQARRIHNQQIEQSSRAIGLTCEREGLYLSDLSFNRWCSRARAQAAAIQQATITNTATGQTLPLASVIARSVSNPEIRRAELMTRISGMERVAKQAGHQCLFVTMTAPEDMHAVKKKSGELLSTAGVSPKKAHEYLVNAWAKIRATLTRADSYVYGIRIAEPHHDGTPHWHLMLFGSADALAAAREALHRFLIRPEHTKARHKHGLRIIRINPHKGSAAGYVAKYVAKSIDAYGIDRATVTAENGTQQSVDASPNEAAIRVRAWASLWGIRQFQFFGQPPVTIWRELRRLDEIANHIAAEAIRKTADAADWEQFVYAMGYAGTGKTADTVSMFKVDGHKPNRYGEETTRAVLEIDGVLYDSHAEQWAIEWFAAAPPWTRDNNCNAERPRGVKTG